ncbi:hypothetical protein [Citrobacter sp. Cf141]|uniref:hypothetical protein n=1 Tax=Citrobacter sp. Cf141 TaxID=2985084 RepID=UPI0025757B7D|nr:hypothetical protein [Citrobacter sp. Cf141]MDM3084197.1 hypothetical protein [Citrobacter sp. Cf141]
MKPAPGVEPVRMYKSPYGGKYGVWRLADCVPMRAKPPSDRKTAAGQRTSGPAGPDEE